jgi:tetratricopeptide (TPR) repeat protein
MKFRVLFTTALAFALVCAELAKGQEPSPGGAPGGAPTTGGGSPSTGNPGGGIPGTGNPNTPGIGRPGQQPGQFPGDPNRNQFPDLSNRPIFLSGKVVTEDGTPPPEPVIIERVCNGQPRPEGYTDSKGRFSFQLGQNTAVMADASVSSTDPFGNSGPNSRGGFGGPQGRGISERDLMGCELRASLPGYRSEAVNLSGRRFMDNPEVGTIILRRLANVQGLTLSATSAMAPKDARKAYEKGRELAKKQKWADAQKEFEKAVTVYPKYANAWTDLGMVQEQLNQPEEARKSYEQAMAQDSRLVAPYIQVAFLEARQNKWKEVAELTDKAVKLNPYDYPRAYFLNAVAYLNMQKLDEAEKSAREGVKVDSRRSVPKIQHVLGVILAQKADYAGATEYMNSYLKTLPANAPDIAVVKKQLAEVEKFAQAPKAAEPQPPQQ